MKAREALELGIINAIAPRGKAQEKPLARAWIRRISRGEVRYLKVGPQVSLQPLPPHTDTT